MPYITKISPLLRFDIIYTHDTYIELIKKAKLNSLTFKLLVQMAGIEPAREVSPAGF